MKLSQICLGLILSKLFASIRENKKDNRPDEAGVRLKPISVEFIDKKFISWKPIDIGPINRRPIVKRQLVKDLLIENPLMKDPIREVSFNAPTFVALVWNICSCMGPN